MSNETSDDWQTSYTEASTPPPGCCVCQQFGGLASIPLQFRSAKTIKDPTTRHLQVKSGSLRKFHRRYQSEADPQLNSSFTEPITVNGAPTSTTSLMLSVPGKYR